MFHLQNEQISDLTKTRSKALILSPNKQRKSRHAAYSSARTGGISTVGMSLPVKSLQDPVKLTQLGTLVRVVANSRCFGLQICK